MNDRLATEDYGGDLPKIGEIISIELGKRTLTETAELLSSRSKDKKTTEEVQKMFLTIIDGAENVIRGGKSKKLWDFNENENLTQEEKAYIILHYCHRLSSDGKKDDQSNLSKQLKQREAELLVRATTKAAAAPLTNLAGKIVGKEQSTGTTWERVPDLARVAQCLDDKFFINAMDDKKTPVFTQAVEGLKELVSPQKKS